MFVVIEHKSKFEEHYIGTLSLGNDIRLFNGTVPPYPEAVLAKEIGLKLERKYGLDFYFPSPIQPDDDCPRWLDRDKGISCEDCGKLIIPTDSPYLPKEICYNCHLERERKERITKDVPDDDGYALYLHSDGEYEQLIYCSKFEDIPLAPFIKDHYEKVDTGNGIKILRLDSNILEQLLIDMEKALDEQIAKYEEPELDDRLSKFYYIDEIEYKGKKYQFEIKFHDSHRKLSRLLRSFVDLQEALNENMDYVISFKRGMTHRDNAFLQFIRKNEGKVEIEKLFIEYRDMLDQAEIRYTLDKLESFECISIKGNHVLVVNDSSGVM